MARTDTSARFALPPFFLVSNALIWISAVIVMGISSYFISESSAVGSHIIYEEVIVSDAAQRNVGYKLQADTCYSLS